MSNNFILGGGIAGLIAKHLNPSYEIISPDTGGQIKKNKNLLMTFFIHNHPECRELLEKLKVPFTEKRVNIYYYYKDKVLDNISIEQKIKICGHKMNEWDYDKNQEDIKDITLSASDNFLDILDCDVNLLIERLTPKKIITGKVKLINNNRKFLVYLDKDNNLQKVDYNKLISTCPANDFFYMLYNYKHNYHFRYLPSTFVLSNKRPEFMIKDGLYYVYSSELIYNRVQNYSGQYIYEICGFPDEGEINKKIGGIIEIERRYVGLLFSTDIDDLKNIKFLGRLSQWDHSIKTQQVIMKAKKIAENER